MKDFTCVLQCACVCVCLCLWVGSWRCPAAQKAVSPSGGLCLFDSPAQEMCRFGDGVSSLNTVLVGYRAPCEPDLGLKQAVLGKTMGQKPFGDTRIGKKNI